MDFGPFVLLSLFYALIGLRVVVQLVKHWRTAFDQRFTPADRSLVDQSAFFILVPISVALHELGHAIAIWSFGGDVVGWGYYAFAGYVSFRPFQFSEAERVVIAAAGTMVNLLLAAGALALVFGRRPPMRAAFNELLLQFTLLSLLNALVVYPALDLFSDLNGDWSQMYRGGVPTLSAVIFVIHVGVLGAIVWAWRSPGPRRRVAELTQPAGGTRWLSPGERRRGGSAGDATADPLEAALREAAKRVASGWPARVEGVIQQQPRGRLLALRWRDGDIVRSVLLSVPDTGDFTLSGAVGVDGAPLVEEAISVTSRTHEAGSLTMALRLAMEEVETWEPAPPGAGSTR